jgi:3-oxoacyl-[acyl-carrier protein] reductase
MMNHPTVAVITGASSGIGKAIALEFAKRGSALLVHGHQNLGGLATTIADIRANAPSSPLWSMVSDISDTESNRCLVDAAFDRFGYVDVWVHAAGADVLTGPSRELNFSTKLKRLFDVDMHGTMILSRMVADRLLRQASHDRRPSMIHIGWDQAEHGMEGDSGQYFSAIKSAVAAFSKSLAKSLAPHVRVNCIAPGWVRTEWGTKSSQSWQQRAIGESMLNRWATPEDIALVAASLSFGDGEFINGQTIAVNGGWQSMYLSARSETKLDD